MHPVVESRRDEVAALCRRFGVKRMEVFGSAARDDFDPARSDIDLLVEFDGPARDRRFATWFDLKEQLEALFARDVDIVDYATVRNPYVRADIDRFRKLLYAA